MLRNRLITFAVLSIACLVCGSGPPAAASDSGAWNAIFLERHTWTGSHGGVTLTADVNGFKIPDTWPEYDWYLINVSTQTEVMKYVIDVPIWPPDTGWCGWYVEDSLTRIDTTVYADGPLLLEDYGPPTSSGTVSDSFTIGGGLNLSNVPGVSIDASFTRTFTHPEVQVFDLSSLAGGYAQWKEEFTCPHGEYSWGQGDPPPCLDSKSVHQMEYAAIVRVAGGVPDSGAHISVNIHAYAYLDKLLAEPLGQVSAIRLLDVLGKDGIEVKMYHNNPPEITSFFPNYTPVTGVAGQRLDFSVSWSDLDGTNDVVTWELDDVQQASGGSWVWDIPSGAGGPTGQTHVIEAVVADESDSTVQTWNVHVEPEPWPYFSATPLLGQAPLTVAFTDLSVNSPQFWAWDFGDGGTSTERNPSHTYTAPGAYTVSLTVSGGGSTNTATKVAYITVGFSDIAQDHWACQEILACMEAGIVGGYLDGCYHPERVVTRDQMAVFVSRGLAGGDGNVPEPTTDPGFTDVDDTHWAYKYICYVVDQHIASGYPEGDYKPDLTVTRDQMAVYVARSICDPTGDEGLVGYVPPETASFSDLPTDYWAYRYVEYCVEQGIVGGYPEGDYKPSVVVTRDQMAVYVARAFELPM